MKKIMVGVCLMSALSGCIVIRDTSTEWKEERIVMDSSGPGSQDASMFFYSKDKYECDSGDRIAIGLYPGFGEAYEKQCVGEHFLGELYLWTPFGWFAKLIGTFSSLFVAPFTADKPAGVGMIGCYRWQSVPGEDVLVERGEKANLMLSIGSVSSCFANKSMDIGKLSNGDVLYYAYPGFGAIYANVANGEQVAVMFDKGPKAYRVFKKAMCVDNAVQYDDVFEGVDKEADQLIFKRRIKVVANNIVQTIKSKEFSFCDESLSNQVLNVARVTRDALSQDKMLNSDFVLSMQKEIVVLRENVLTMGRIAEKINMLNELMAQEKYEEVLAAKKVEDTNNGLIAIYDRARDLLEEKRVVNKLENVKDKYDKGIFDGVLSDIVNETDVRFEEIEQVVRSALGLRDELKRRFKEARDKGK